MAVIRQGDRVCGSERLAVELNVRETATDTAWVFDGDLVVGDAVLPPKMPIAYSKAGPVFRNARPWR